MLVVVVDGSSCFIVANFYFAIALLIFLMRLEKLFKNIGVCCTLFNLDCSLELSYFCIINVS